MHEEPGYSECNDCGNPKRGYHCEVELCKQTLGQIS
jgi:ribosomal protein S14